MPSPPSAQMADLAFDANRLLLITRTVGECRQPCAVARSLTGRVTLPARSVAGRATLPPHSPAPPSHHPFPARPPTPSAQRSRPALPPTLRPPRSLPLQRPGPIPSHPQSDCRRRRRRRRRRRWQDNVWKELLIMQARPFRRIE